MSYREAKVARDQSQMIKAGRFASAVDPFVKGLKGLGENQKKKQVELQKLRKGAAQATQGYSNLLAKYKKTGRANLDEQVVKQIENMARDEAKLYMDSVSPEADEDALFKWQTRNAQNLAGLMDLTTFIGTLDKDLDFRDQGIKDNRLIPSIGEDGNEIEFTNAEEFKNGLGIGASEVTLDKDANGQWQVRGRSINTPNADETVINLRQYSEDIKNNGGTLYNVMDEDMETQVDAYGGQVVDEDIMSRIEVKYQSQDQFADKRAELSQELADIKKDKGVNSPEWIAENKKFKKWKTDHPKMTYTQADKDEAYDIIRNKLEEDSSGGLKSYKKDSVVPKEAHLWKFLQDQGYIEEIDDIYENANGDIVDVTGSVSWDQYNDPRKMEYLNDAYAQYLLDKSIMKGETGSTVKKKRVFGAGGGKTMTRPF